MAPIKSEEVWKCKLSHFKAANSLRLLNWKHAKFKLVIS